MKDVTKKETVASTSRSWKKAQKKRCHKIRRLVDKVSARGSEVN